MRNPRNRKVFPSLHPKSYQARDMGQIVQCQVSCNFCRLFVHCFNGSPMRRHPAPDDHVLLANHPSWELGIEMSPYDRLKSEAYSNKFDLRSKAKKCSRLAYRLVIFVKEEPEICGCIQYLADDEVRDENRQFFGRVINADRVDVVLLKDWLSRCKYLSPQQLRVRWCGRSTPS